jgi:hypothetical protein
VRPRRTACAAFAAAAAKRYAPQGIHTWEVWNEENFGFWKPAPNPAAYAALLRQTSAALHAADPTARVVLDGLAATNTGPGRISPTDFLSAVAWTGALRTVNAVGYRPYTFPYLASARTALGTSREKIDRTRVSLHSVVAGNGFPHLPIRVTEFGAPTGGRGTTSDGSAKTITPSTTHVTEGSQAQIAAEWCRDSVWRPNLGMTANRAVATWRRQPPLSTLSWPGQVGIAGHDDRSRCIPDAYLTTTKAFAAQRLKPARGWKQAVGDPVLWVPTPHAPTRPSRRNAPRAQTCSLTSVDASSACAAWPATS